MKLKTLELSVGVFVLCAIASLLMLALMVSGLSSFNDDDKGYLVSAEFTNIGSLKPRAKVALSGVTIGRVLKIELDPKTFNAKVDMLIHEKINQIPDDSHASILTAGLLGDNYIGFNPGFSMDHFLKQGSNLTIENTESAVVLEQLISKFMSSEASSTKKVKEDAHE